jgi:hypothetical protein
MSANNSYTITTNIWLYPGLDAWHFIAVPKKESAEIKTRFAPVRRGWGSVPVQVTIGATTWRTSIFPDSKVGSYILPIKKEVRKKEHIENGDTITLVIVFGV